MQRCVLVDCREGNGVGESWIDVGEKAIGRKMLKYRVQNIGRKRVVQEDHGTFCGKDELRSVLTEDFGSRVRNGNDFGM